MQHHSHVPSLVVLQVLWDKEDHEAFNKLLLNEEGRR
jgi:hypothetical protein